MEKRNERMAYIGNIINAMNKTADGVVPEVGDTLYYLSHGLLMSIKVTEFAYDDVTGTSERDGQTYCTEVTKFWADPIKAWENYRQACISEMKEITARIKSDEDRRIIMGNEAINAALEIGKLRK